MGPWDALGNLIVGIHRTGKVQAWSRLVFGMVFSYAITFSFVTGSALVGGAGWAVSVGSGMVSGAAMAAVAFFRAKPDLTKDVTIAIPAGVTDAAVNEKGQGPMISESRK